MVKSLIIALALFFSASLAPSAEIEIPFTMGKTIRNGSGFVTGCALTVGTVGADDRMVLEYDLTNLPTSPTSIIWATHIVNSPLGEAEIDILDFYSYAGDGKVTLDEFDAGEWFVSVEYSENPPIPPTPFLFVDVSNDVNSLIDEGKAFLGIRVSTVTDSVWILGSSAATNWPDPFLVVEFDGYGLMDLVSFNACLGGPGAPASESCEATFDFDNDGDVDLRDYAVFQQRFDG